MERKSNRRINKASFGNYLIIKKQVSRGVNTFLNVLHAQWYRGLDYRQMA